jgi:hypothetical protein
LKTIWKYVLQPESVLDMPIGAQVLSVREQGQEICLWALVDPLADKEKRKFVSFGTGHDIPSQPMTFIGTAHLGGGSLVFHVFETFGE